MKSRYILMAEMFKALGDENRLKLLEELKDGEKNAGELLLSLSVTQPTLSHHMKILCDSGIVDARREGKWTYYRISKEGKKELVDIINSLTGNKVKPDFDIEEITADVLTEKVEKAKKSSVKKAAKKKPEHKNKEDYIVETLIPPKTEEEEKKERTERNMPSWLF